MENIADYIPLMIILGSLIVSAFTGKKKKKIPQSNEPANEPVPYFPESTSWEKAPTVFLNKKTEPQMLHKQPVSKAKAKKYAMEPNQPNVERQETGKPVLNIQDLDEVKKAIVYSEIFNRKEY